MDPAAATSRAHVHVRDVVGGGTHANSTTKNGKKWKQVSLFSFCYDNHISFAISLAFRMTDHAPGCHWVKQTTPWEGWKWSRKVYLKELSTYLSPLWYTIQYRQRCFLSRDQLLAEDHVRLSRGIRVKTWWVFSLYDTVSHDFFEWMCWRTQSNGGIQTTLVNRWINWLDLVDYLNDNSN